MNTQFTPGPWKVGYSSYQVTACNDQMNICDIRGWGYLTGGGSLKLDEKSAKAIQDANAHLIAAAPRMYEALQRVVAEYSQDTTAEPIGALIARIDNANHFIQEVLKEARGEHV